MPAVDRNTGTVLRAASRHGHLGVARLLLRHGADVDVLNKTNQTAVAMQLTRSWHRRMAKAKLQSSFPEYKADANIRNKLRSTTLDTVEYGADDDGKDEVQVSLRAAPPRKRETSTT